MQPLKQLYPFILYTFQGYKLYLNSHGKAWIQETYLQQKLETTLQKAILWILESYFMDQVSFIVDFRQN